MASPTNNNLIQAELAVINALLHLSIDLDDLDSDNSHREIQPGKLNGSTYTNFTNDVERISTKKNALVANIDNVFRANVQKYIDSIDQKIKLLQSKYTLYDGPAPSLVSSVPTLGSNLLGTPSNAASSVPQIPLANPLIQFAPPVNNTVTTTAPRNVSFKVIDAPQLPEAPKQSLSVTLSRVSYFLRHNQEGRAFEEFKNLPEDVKRAVFGALWVVCGKPMPGNPIAHDNFGEVSFFNHEQRCASTSQQKACAVELMKTEHSIKEVITLLKADQFEGAKKIFLKLPPQIQRAIYEVHWNVCGGLSLPRNMAHDNFGEVSFLGQEQRCAVPCSKKAETLETYLPQFLKNSEAAQELVAGMLQNFKDIDNSQRTVSASKTIDKNQSIHAFATQIIGIFLGQEHKVELPVLDNTTRPEVMVEAYIKKYPFLKPFLMQIASETIFGEEILEVHGASHLPKLSCALNPNLSSMPSDAHRRLYNIGVMNETLETLTQGFYINSKGEKVELNLDDAIKSLMLCAGVPSANHNVFVKNPQIILANRDCLSVAQDCVLRGKNPIVLDLASNHKFGGGYKTGASAQEEDITRRTGLCFAVDPTQGKQKRNFYPINSYMLADRKNNTFQLISRKDEQAWEADATGLYVSHVPVFRGEAKQGYPYLDQPFEAAFAIMPGYNFNPALPEAYELQDGRIPHALIPGIEAKIRTVLEMAKENKHDVVVLGALSCGAFKAPPTHMAGLMLNAIIQGNFHHSFEEIHFAIFDDHNSQGNYAAFKGELEFNKSFLEDECGTKYREAP